MMMIHRRRVVRTTLVMAVAIGACVVSLAAGTDAQAATPTQFRLTDAVSFTDTTLCGFPIAVNLELTIVGRVYRDNSGSFLGLTADQNAVGTDSANAITLNESDHWVDMFNSSFDDHEVGLPIHIRVQGGGAVIRDAGYLFINPDGSVAYMHGPHPSLEGENASVCAALS